MASDDVLKKLQKNARDAYDSRAFKRRQKKALLESLQDKEKNPGEDPKKGKGKKHGD